MYLIIIGLIIVRSRTLIFVIFRELILIIVILKIWNINKRNIIIFYLLNLVRSFLLFIRVLIDNYGVLIIANIMKLGLFPFTHLIIIFYADLNCAAFIILNLCKLPYLYLISIKLRTLLILMTMAYSLLSLAINKSVMLIIRVYSVISRVIILNLDKSNLKTYFFISLIRIYLCLIRNFEVVRVYNLISLPLRLTFYIKIQFLMSLRLLNLMWVVGTFTLVLLCIVKYITTSNRLSKWVFGLLLINCTII